MLARLSKRLDKLKEEGMALSRQMDRLKSDLAAVKERIAQAKIVVRPRRKRLQGNSRPRYLMKNGKL